MQVSIGSRATLVLVNGQRLAPSGSAGAFTDVANIPLSAIDHIDVLTSGGSEANLTALVVARERLRYEQRDRAVLYVSEQRHWSVDRAAKIIGLRAEQVQAVPVDAGLSSQMVCSGGRSPRATARFMTRTTMAA